MTKVLKIGTLALLLFGAVGTGYLVWEFKAQAGLLASRSTASLPETHEATTAEAGGHGDAHAPAGHGEAAAGHGEAAEASAGHGDGHGGAPGGGHGETAAVKEPEGIPLVGFDEIFVNVGGPEGPVRSLGLKIELELFNEKETEFIEPRKKGIQDAVIQVSREQDFKRLSTLQGKLYFKELLASRINEFLQQPSVREVHFSSFFLQ